MPTLGPSPLRRQYKILSSVCMTYSNLLLNAIAGLVGGLAAGQGVTRAPGEYNQPLRPQYHFSPQKNWTNDPNGPVYFEGEYHLFFQYNPFGDIWGHMSWGHAVSPDLVHWKELPVALTEENGVMIFTGSTVVDRQNSSGFCEGGKACLVATDRKSTRLKSSH